MAVVGVMGSVGGEAEKSITCSGSGSVLGSALGDDGTVVETAGETVGLGASVALVGGEGEAGVAAGGAASA